MSATINFVFDYQMLTLQKEDRRLRIFINHRLQYQKIPWLADRLAYPARKPDSISVELHGDDNIEA